MAAWVFFELIFYFRYSCGFRHRKEKASTDSRSRRLGRTARHNLLNKFCTMRGFATPGFLLILNL